MFKTNQPKETMKKIRSKKNDLLNYFNCDHKDLSKEYLANEGQRGGTQNKIILPDGVVKIVVEEAGYDYIREARRVEFDGRKFAIKSDGNPDGLVDNQFFTFTLTPIDE